MYKSDYKFFERAVDLALNGEHRVRVGALAVARGKPVAGAWNVVRNTSPVDYRDMTEHAEMACLMMVSKRLKPATTLYVARINKAGDYMPSLPCPRCRVILRTAGIKAVVFCGEAQILHKLSLNWES